MISTLFLLIGIALLIDVGYSIFEYRELYKDTLPLDVLIEVTISLISFTTGLVLRNEPIRSIEWQQVMKDKSINDVINKAGFINLYHR